MVHSKRARDNKPMLKQGQLTLDIRKHLSTMRTMGVNDIKLLAINIPMALLLSNGKKVFNNKRTVSCYFTWSLYKGPSVMTEVILIYNITNILKN